jgi:hypothetical protein
MTIRLLESHITAGGISVTVVATEPQNQLARTVEVPVGRDLHLTAIGGNGEDGQTGGDGQNGMAGIDGVNATEVADATPGGNGGHGGNAGKCTNGADGGGGGTIEIIVPDSTANLLVSSDVSGGIGGTAGRHGTPGKGGQKGRGGKGHSWEVQVGYIYNCTDNCIGRQGATEQNALVRYNSRHHGTTRMLARMTSQSVSGNDLAGVITEVAARYHAVRNPRVEPGACHCKGGQGNCTGCEPKPLIKKFQRVAGLNGEDGMDGVTTRDALFNGLNGHDGRVVYVLEKDDGTQIRYETIYKVQLVDFDLEDENGDGVFEPGEHLYVRRIRVRNTGTLSKR